MNALSPAEVQRLRGWLADGAPISLSETETPAGQAVVSGLISVGVNGRDRTEALHRTLRALYNGGAEAVAADIFAAAPAPDTPAVEVPALPTEAQLDPDFAVGASPWLDRYAAFSAHWSPAGAPCYHEAIGVWLLSTLAARRIVLRLGSASKYTSLYLALVGRSSLYAKTTTARIGTDLLKHIGADWLLAPDDSTPQRFISDMTGRVPGNYDELPPDKQARIKKRLSRAAQRSWRYEEFGSLVSQMVRDNGIMADFRSILRRMDDCADTYEYSTLGRGSDLIEGPYLALLASLTPADLKPIAKAGSAFWGDGTLARFALVTPTTRPTFAPFPDGEMTFPDDLSAPLLRWHERLGLPRVDLEDVLDAKTQQPTGRKIVHLGPYTERSCTFGAGVFDAFNAYHRALLLLVDRSTITDLDANYARFAEKALRVAMLLASLENDGRIELAHWARAQQLTEGWRAGLHALIAQMADATTTSTAADQEEKISNAVKRHPGLTAGKVPTYVRGVSVGEATRLLDGLVKAGVLRGEMNRRNTIAYYPVLEPGAVP